MWRPPGRPVLLLILAAAFAVAHTQAPLFYSNQNQYLLHGLAAAGYGHLSADWLANTKDPTPLFSAGVAVAYRVAGLWALQAGYFVLLMGYFLAAWWLVSGGGILGGARASGPHPERAGGPRSAEELLAFAALFTAAHAAILRWLSVQLTGVDYPWYLQAGVAGQYVLGPGLQPSAFGVLLVVSLAAFANGRPYLAGGLAAGAVVMHATYGLPAGLLTLGYLAGLWRGGRRRTALGVGLLALLIAAPAVAYAAATFRQTGPNSAYAVGILVWQRIPHHAVVRLWFDRVAVAQIGWMLVGLAAVYRTRLFAPLAVTAAGGYALTVAQLALESNRLALLFPWRVSVVLVPVTTAVLAARLASWLTGGGAGGPSAPPPLRGRSANEVSRVGGGPVESDPPPAARRRPPPQGGRWVAWASALVIAVLAVGGIAVMALGLGYRTNEAERPVLDWVRDHARPGDVYLIPTRGPQGGPKARGVLSATFLPPPRPGPGSPLIPVDLQRFRLHTGVPIYVDFKSVPYADREVLEWHRRVRMVELWYDQPDWDAAEPVSPFGGGPAPLHPVRGLRDQIRAEGITHVVVPRDRPIRGSFLDEVYADGAYTVYRVR
jgi:hypothetical protein